MKETTWDAAPANLLLMDIHTMLRVNWGEKDRQFSQHIIQLMNDQNALFAESHLGMFFQANSGVAEAQILHARITGLRNIQ